jgi:hypothetical protein
MANIFKTTLKKEVIVDIVDNKKREIRFPITKFWATRFADKYNLEEKTFEFKTFDSLELSSPSNKDTISEIYTFGFVRTFVDGDEFVVEFKANEEVAYIAADDGAEALDIETVIEETTEVDDPVCEKEINETNVDILFEPEEDCDSDNKDVDDEEILHVSDEDVYAVIKEWCNEKILNTLYDNETEFTTNVNQIVILSNGRVLGSKKTLPVNNDADIRIDLDMSKMVYYDPTLDINIFMDDIYNTLEEICKNNFVFICRRYTGIFMDGEGRIYFGIKYSTRKSVGFKRKYNVQ